MVRLETTRAIFRVGLAGAYLAAGVAHLATPGPFLRIIPTWAPEPELVIAATGVAEILGAAALVAAPGWRRRAGLALALYAVCVFPANVKHALDAVTAHGPGAWWPYHAPRLAFQPVIVWWALFAGDLLAWPFRARPSGGPAAARRKHP